MIQRVVFRHAWHRPVLHEGCKGVYYGIQGVPLGLQEQHHVVKAAVKKAEEAWGERRLSPLEAEDRLAIACEKAPVDDPVLQELRGAFRALEDVYEPVCRAQKGVITALGGLHVIGTGARAACDPFCC
jgi:hypothetical protein